MESWKRYRAVLAWRWHVFEDRPMHNEDRVRPKYDTQMRKRALHGKSVVGFTNPITRQVEQRVPPMERCGRVLSSFVAALCLVIYAGIYAI